MTAFKRNTLRVDFIEFHKLNFRRTQRDGVATQAFAFAFGTFGSEAMAVVIARIRHNRVTADIVRFQSVSPLQTIVLEIERHLFVQRHSLVRAVVA